MKAKGCLGVGTENNPWVFPCSQVKLIYTAGAKPWRCQALGYHLVRISTLQQGTWRVPLLLFERQVITVNKEFGQSEIFCNNCGADIQSPSIRYVCRSCEDIDLCSGCYLVYQLEGFLGNDLTLECQSHEFLAVSRNEWSFSPSQIFLVDGTIARDWIESI